MVKSAVKNKNVETRGVTPHKTDQDSHNLTSNLLCYRTLLTEWQHGQMLLIVTHSHKNHSQTKIILNHAETVEISCFSETLFTDLITSIIFFLTFLIHLF
jgi:hypothetical protein